MTFNEKQREFENLRLREIEDYCEDCGEHYEECECHGEPDFEPDDYVSDFDADMAADRYFGDY